MSGICIFMLFHHFCVLLPSLFWPSPPPAAAPPPHAWEAPLSVSPPLRASRQLSRRESQVYARGQRKLCGKTKFFQLCLTTNFAKTDAGTLASPRGGGGTALCAVTERGGSHACGGAVMPLCGMTERAIAKRLRGEQGRHEIGQQKTPPSGLGTEEPFVRRKIRRECFCVPGDWTCKPVLVGTA